MYTSQPCALSASRSFRATSRSVMYSAMPVLTPAVPEETFAFVSELPGATGSFSPLACS